MIYKGEAYEKACFEGRPCWHGSTSTHCISTYLMDNDVFSRQTELPPVVRRIIGTFFAQCQRNLVLYMDVLALDVGGTDELAVKLLHPSNRNLPEDGWAACSKYYHTNIAFAS